MSNQLVQAELEKKLKESEKKIEELHESLLASLREIKDPEMRKAFIAITKLIDQQKTSVILDILILESSKSPFYTS